MSTIKETVKIPCWNCSADSDMVSHTAKLAHYKCPKCGVEYVTGLDDDGKGRGTIKSMHMTRIHYGSDGSFYTTAVTNPKEEM